jgi:hypothetical protein
MDFWDWKDWQLLINKIYLILPNHRSDNLHFNNTSAPLSAQKWYPVQVSDTTMMP